MSTQSEHSRLVKIGEASEFLGVTPQTLRAWESSGELLPARKSRAGTRYYLLSDLEGVKNWTAPTICYARVSTAKQKGDLERQQASLEAYCAAKGWNSLTLKDVGSGINYRKKGLQELLERILRRQIRRLVITHKDRLLRFGSELIFALCEMQGVEIVIIHRGEQPSFEEELAQDVLEIITVFSARLYGARSRKHKEIMGALSEEDVPAAAKQLSLMGTQNEADSQDQAVSHA